MFSSGRLRPIMLAMAMLIMTAMMATDAQVVQAKCCEVTVKNQSSCTVEAVLSTTSKPEGVKVTLPPGTTVFPITCGDDWAFWFVDMCNPFSEVRVFPYEWSLTMRLSKTCCVNVTGIPLEPCSMLITDARCPC